MPDGTVSEIVGKEGKGIKKIEEIARATVKLENKINDFVIYLWGIWIYIFN